MASLFPASVDTFSTPTAGSATSSPSHATLHVNVNNAITNAQTYMGLVLIKSQTIGTAVTSVEVTSAFSATYDAYKIVATGVTVTGGNESVSMTLGNSSGYTVSGYDSGMIFNSAGVSTVANGNATSWNFVCSYGTATGMPLNIDVYSPFQASPTAFSGIYARADNYGTPTGTLTGTTSYDRFTLQLVSSGSLTGGKIRVYGYRQ